MGLSASQARLLNLTNRMHQIEYNASRIEAMKLQMANESRRVYEDYLEALDQAKVQRKTLTTNGAVTFVDIKSYDDFMNSGFKLVVHGSGLGSSGTLDTSKANPNYKTYETALKAAKDAAAAAGTDFDQAAWETENYPEGIPPATIPAEIQIKDNAVVCSTKEQVIDALKQVCNVEVSTSAFVTNFEEFLTNMINCGYVTIIQKPADPSKYGGANSEQLDADGFPNIGSEAYRDWETSVAINTSLQEVQDESKLRKAEAKYEADMKRIDMKDRRYDADLAALDNERNAIKQEMETLKTVARDNVDRTFKIFS